MGMLCHRWDAALHCCSIEQAGVKEEDDDEDEEEEDGDEEMTVPEGIDVDPVVMSTLPHSMQVRSPTC